MNDATPGVIADPFPHLVLDGNCQALDEPVPPPEWGGWEVVYRDDCQRGKRTTRGVGRLGGAVASLFWALAQPGMAGWFGDLFDIPDLEPDPTLHGGGLHVMPPGSSLAGHLDYALHPHLPGKERRLNVIAYLNPEWHEAWGGALCLLDPMGAVVKRIYPAPGRVVAFETGDLSYHAVEPVTGPTERVTAAVYFLTAARPGVTRKRAMFFPTRDA